MTCHFSPLSEVRHRCRVVPHTTDKTPWCRCSAVKVRERGRSETTRGPSAGLEVRGGHRCDARTSSTREQPPPAYAVSAWRRVRSAGAATAQSGGKGSTYRPTSLAPLAGTSTVLHARGRAFRHPPRPPPRLSASTSSLPATGRFGAHDEPLGRHRKASVHPTSTTSCARAPALTLSTLLPLRRHGRRKPLDAAHTRRQRRASSL